jgi:hypothetical protein
MNRREFAAAVAAGTAAALVTAAPAQPAGSPAKNIVMVHGLYADGSCRSGVIVQLQAAGLKRLAL